MSEQVFLTYYGEETGLFAEVLIELFVGSYTCGLCAIAIVTEVSKDVLEYLSAIVCMLTYVSEQTEISFLLGDKSKL